MMTAENPMGLDGFEFLEFASPSSGLLEPVFEFLGFKAIAKHRSKEVVLYRQGNINFILNNEPRHIANYFAKEHGPSVCGMAFRVVNAQTAYERALSFGAQPMNVESGPMEIRLPAIRGIGDAPLYLVEQLKNGLSIYDVDFEYFDNVDRYPNGLGLKTIDHLTHNVYRGRMSYWADFYTRLFNFRELKYFDVKGEYTGLTSKAMSAPDGKIRIPLNEESQGGGGQIEEFLIRFNGEGIQHIALSCDDLIATVDKLVDAGVPLMAAPNSRYYEMIESRVPNHGQDIDEIQKRGILLDGVATDGQPRLLLQIFSKTLLGPVFFEFIQRKGDEGFGEGNFKALFESLERDQLDRGALQFAESDS
jgi:4-hydroxyphenylpyruvate dioxygenase